MTITKTTVLDLEPANANWVVSVEREDYADPTEESGVLLSVGRTTVMLTPAEARQVAAALIEAAGRSGGDPVADPEPDDPEPITCERCGGSGYVVWDQPGTARYGDCANCDGTGREP